MQLFLHTKSKLTLLVCLLLFVANAVPAPTTWIPTPPPPVHVEEGKSAISSKPIIARPLPLLDTDKAMPKAFVAAELVVYATKEVLHSESFDNSLILAAKTLLKPAIPTIIGLLDKTHSGLDYTITDDPQVSVTEFGTLLVERPPPEEFYQLGLKLEGRDNTGKIWEMESVDETYVLTISKKCVVPVGLQRRMKSTKPEVWQFKPQLLSGELRQFKSKEPLTRFKNGMQLDLQAAGTAEKPPTTAKQKFGWLDTLKNNVFPT
ncbi:hypothetical protein F5878DRAFT_355072 [Lentinula raphanica]|uniref:Uncharacterized protein n=1 Tax=Lentinula raphanica TaxID=153919 RepID=A0AA38P1D4_9AGAR|nr:hypothetical protein F5878DRAFT_355072 [Lentinula raphanica]